MLFLLGQYLVPLNQGQKSNDGIAHTLLHLGYASKSEEDKLRIATALVRDVVCKSPCDRLPACFCCTMFLCPTCSVFRAPHAVVTQRPLTQSGPSSASVGVGDSASQPLAASPHDSTALAAAMQAHVVVAEAWDDRSHMDVIGCYQVSFQLARLTITCTTNNNNPAASVSVASSHLQDSAAGGSEAKADAAGGSAVAGDANRGAEIRVDFNWAAKEHPRCGPAVLSCLPCWAACLLCGCLAAPVYCCCRWGNGRCC